MQMLPDLYSTHPLWIWLALGAILLAAEVLTGSGWLLWPAASAGITAALTGLHLGGGWDVIVFAGLTIITTYVARRWLMKTRIDDGPDINDQRERLIGVVGEAVSPFVAGHGRAFVNGAEWPADLEAGDVLAKGAKVVVTAVSGSRLTVRTA